MAQLLVGMVFPKRDSLEIIIGLYVFTGWMPFQISTRATSKH